LRILAVSDFHSDLESVRKTAVRASEKNADLIVVCGDITHFGKVDEALYILKLLEKRPVFFVPGNCDPEELAERSTDGAQNLHGQMRISDDLAFVGVGGASTGDSDDPFEIAEVDLYGLVDKAFEAGAKRFVLVSHAPPENTKVDSSSDGSHVGNASLRRLIEDKKPLLALCGHIHEARGIDILGETVIVNPGPARHGFCSVIDVGDKVEATLDSL